MLGSQNYYNMSVLSQPLYKLPPSGYHQKNQKSMINAQVNPLSTNYQTTNNTLNHALTTKVLGGSGVV